MRLRPVLVVFLLLLIALPCLLDAQRRRKQDEPTWPPEQAYSRLFLGGALQDVFARHYDFCGFTKAEGKRDYTPPTIEKFLGKRSLRTRVEKADIHGGSLMNYVFSEREVSAPLDAIRYTPGNLLYAANAQAAALPEPRDGFDSFVLTKNCGGYLKSALDAGLKPPYAAFAAALETDAKRSSSVLALAGSFQSPLVEELSAGDERTTALLARLWQFYLDHPEFRQEAYYLRQFEGVLIKHLTDAEEVMAAEQSVGINVNLPLSASINSSLSHRRENQNSFSASDWETIVYADFTGPYTREAMFAALPGPEQIAAYFAGLPAVSATAVPLREAATHRHSVEIGLPDALANAGWTIADLRGGAYQHSPDLTVRATEAGLNFTVQGQTEPSLFRNGQQELVTIAYDLVLPARDGMPQLRVPVQQRMNTSAHPLVELAGTRFELRRRNSGEYAFQWHLTVNVEDRENPLDASGNFTAGSLQLHDKRGDVLAARVVTATYDARRTVLTVTLESERSWPLREIDDRHMQSLPIEAELILPVKDGYSACRRLVTARLAVPRILVAPATPPLVLPSPPALDPAQG